MSLKIGITILERLGFAPTTNNMIRWVLDPRRFLYLFFVLFFSTCKKIFIQNKKMLDKKKYMSAR